MSSVDFASMAVFLVVFILTGGIGAILFYRTYGYERVVQNRLRELAPDQTESESMRDTGSTPSLLSTLGAIMLPASEEKRAPFLKQMRQAGLNDPRALQIFYGVKFVLILALPVFLALVPFLFGSVSFRWALVSSSAAAASGILIPNLWLDGRIRRRTRELRAALPDMLDMLVMCTEGGLSFQAGLQRVVGEIPQIHPTLGRELRHLMQAIEMGATIGEAFKQFGTRCDMAEVRDLAAVIEQSEKYGASLMKSLRTHADQFREERQMRAEEMAQKASVKILFPMLICIFPAVFVVLLGPAAFQIVRIFKQ